MIIEASQLSYATAYRSASATAVIDSTRQATPVSQPSRSDTVQLSAFSGREDLQGLDGKQLLAVLAIEALVGHKINLMRSSGGATAAARAPAASAATVHQHTEVHSEMEQSGFQAQGEVETADGRHIQFAAELTMRRSFQSISTSTSTAPANQSTDPLVMNLGGSPAQLTGAKIAFDLNSDGKQETISFVAGGSGFLAIDANGDGKVNNGKELFGPQSGNGFADLAAYDSDGNGWIDEADPVFSKLRIWTQSGLTTLAQNGIGAISTSSAETPFTIKDAANTTQGQVRATGIYLNENGSAGTIQQVDLAS